VCVCVRVCVSVCVHVCLCICVCVGGNAMRDLSEEVFDVFSEGF